MNDFIGYEEIEENFILQKEVFKKHLEIVFIIESIIIVEKELI